MRDEAYKLLLKLEGGFQESNLQGDSGGRTFAGITSKTWFDWHHKNGTVAAWPPSSNQVEEFYDQVYWFAFNCHLIPPPADAVYFQIAVNLPPFAAHQILQNVLGAFPDGNIGSATLDLFKTQVPELFARMLLIAQAQHYCDVRKPTDHFFNGLLNRIKIVRNELSL